MKEARDFLNQLKKLDKMLENKEVERQQWKSIATNTVSHNESERVQSSGSQQKMADAIDKYVDMEAEIAHCIDELIETKKDVISVIEQLDTAEYDLLHKVYVQYIPLDDVAARYNKTYSWATTIHGKALKNVKRILDDRKRMGCNELQ
jgi:flagellar capping protein FliD